MRIAYFSDVHGNTRALEAVLEDIGRASPDFVVCGGDIVNPYLSSLETWQRLRELSIPVLRGNHEDYITLYHGEMPRAFLPPEAPAAAGAPPDVRAGVQFRPIHHVAERMGPDLARELASLPFALRIPGPGGDDVYACHASPLANNRSYRYVRGPEMDAALAATGARTLISGHIHLPWQQRRGGQLLVVAGSVGIPMSGRPEPEYTLLEHLGGEWRVEHRSVAYDHEGALREFRETRLAELGGPVAWLLYDEILCAERRLAEFLPRLRMREEWPRTLAHWEDLAREFLRDAGRWGDVQRHLGL